MMSLYFSRRRFFETSFYEPNIKNSEAGLCDFAEVYRVSTTVRSRSIFPGTTTIEYVAPEDEEKHRVIAKIEWRWPSQIGSIIEINGKRMMLKDFLKRDENLLSTGTHVMIGDERFTWRSAVFRPAQLYDSHKRSVARYNPQVHGLRPWARAISIEPGCLHLEPDVAFDGPTRDMIIASFFAYRACRDFHIILKPWWCRSQGDFAGVRVKIQEEANDEECEVTDEKELM